MKKVVTEALVLGRINYAEADKIVTLLTPAYGKLSVVAKGVRKSKSKAAGGIELFTLSEVSFIESTKELKTLVSARAKTFYGNILKDLHATQEAYNALQVTNSFTESLCEPGYFGLLQYVLQALNEGVEATIVGAWFAVRIIALSGHGISTAIEQQSANYGFSIQDMEFSVQVNGSYTQNHIKLLRLLQKQPLQKVLLVQSAQQYCQDLLPLLRQLTKIYSNKNL